MKKLSIVFSILVLSLIINVVLVKNINGFEKQHSEEKKEIQDEYEGNLSSLEGQIKLLEEDILNQDPEYKEEVSKTTLDEQKDFINVASSFIKSYLDYDNQRLDERRSEIETYVSEEIIDRVAPKENENAENELSYDPTFTSSIKDYKTYITDGDNNNVRNIIIDATYDTESTEGKAKVRALIFLDLIKNDDGHIKITSFKYEPVI